MSGKTTSQQSKRDKWVETGKLCGDLIMYIGSAAIASSAVRKVKENSNGLMGACATGTGAVLSVGAGKIASNILNKIIDKTVAFFDDVKPEEKKTVTEDEENEEEGS